jgi:hypothetical protein
LHDLQNLDRRGVPGCAVATEAFRQAAEAQMTALGFAAGLAWVPHPVQNRTPAELAALAEAALPEVLALIERRPG